MLTYHITWAPVEARTRDLPLPRRALYHWATSPIKWNRLNRLVINYKPRTILVQWQIFFVYVICIARHSSAFLFVFRLRTYLCTSIFFIVSRHRNKLSWTQSLFPEIQNNQHLKTMTNKSQNSIFGYYLVVSSLFILSTSIRRQTYKSTTQKISVCDISFFLTRSLIDFLRSDRKDDKTKLYIKSHIFLLIPYLEFSHGDKAGKNLGLTPGQRYNGVVGCCDLGLRP